MVYERYVDTECKRYFRDYQFAPDVGTELVSISHNREKDFYDLGGD